jgi:hypothetical protein
LTKKKQKKKTLCLKKAEYIRREIRSIPKSLAQHNQVKGQASFLLPPLFIVSVFFGVCFIISRRHCAVAYLVLYDDDGEANCVWLENKGEPVGIKGSSLGSSTVVFDGECYSLKHVSSFCVSDDFHDSNPALSL